MSSSFRGLKSTMLLSVFIIGAFCFECCASYMIQLNDGGLFFTNRYWEEGNQIKLYLYDGIIGIEKHLIKEITEADEPYEPYRMEQPDPIKNDPIQQASNENPDLSATEKNPPIETKKLLNEKRSLSIKLKSASSDLRDAKATNDREKTRSAWKKIITIQTQLSELDENVKKLNGGNLPVWWGSNPSPPAAVP